MTKRILLILALLFLAGCKSQTTTKSEATKSAEPPPVSLSGKVNNHGNKSVESEGASLEVEQDDFYFEPTFIKGKPGSSVKVELHNEGTQDHSFTVDSLQIDQVVSADQKAEVTVNLPSSGVVNFYCRFHRDQGMQGAFYFSAE